MASSHQMYPAEVCVDVAKNTAQLEVPNIPAFQEVSQGDTFFCQKVFKFTEYS